MTPLRAPGGGHALVVGGTGMLREVCLALARAPRPVSVLARPSARLDALTRATGGAAVGVDWADEPAVRREVARAASAHGPVSLVVCWAHSDAPHVPTAVAETVASAAAPPRFFQVYGGRADASQPTKRRWHEALSTMPGIAYRRVRLWAEGGRWLSDAEIARGVLAAVADDAPDREVLPAAP